MGNFEEVNTSNSSSVILADDKVVTQVSSGASKSKTTITKDYIISEVGSVNND